MAERIGRGLSALLRYDPWLRRDGNGYAELGDVLSWATAQSQNVEDVLEGIETSQKRGRPRFQVVVLRARSY
eukprot:4739307-Lingulodinium_polyedra.AAC.1